MHINAILIKKAALRRLFPTGKVGGGFMCKVSVLCPRIDKTPVYGRKFRISCNV